MKDKKILKELRKGPMKSMKDDEYAMIEKEVDEKGIAGLKGYAKSMIEKAMRDMAYSMKDTMKKHQEHDQSSHGNWAGSGGASMADIAESMSELDEEAAEGAPRKIAYGDIEGTSKQGSVTTTPGVLDKLFGKGVTVEGDEFERKVTEEWTFEMTNPSTGKSFKAAIYDWMRYDEMGLSADEGQKLAPMGRSESGTFSIGASSREDAKAVEDYIAANSGK